MLLKLFHEIEMEAKFPNSFYEASISVVPILDKGRTKKKKTYTSLSLMNLHTNMPNQILAN
jgi:hypothetical protein